MFHTAGIAHRAIAQPHDRQQNSCPAPSVVAACTKYRGWEPLVLPLTCARRCQFSWTCRGGNIFVRSIQMPELHRTRLSRHSGKYQHSSRAAVAHEPVVEFPAVFCFPGVIAVVRSLGHAEIQQLRDLSVYVFKCFCLVLMRFRSSFLPHTPFPFESTPELLEPVATPRDHGLATVVLQVYNDYLPTSHQCTQVDDK